jgi:SAM-dependent methyltransferase
MEPKQSSEEEAATRPVQAILELRNAENSAAYILAKLQFMKEQNPSLKLLDVGCGPGTISSALAKLIPEGHVTGIDIYPDILVRAKELIEQAGIKNIDFQHGDINKLPFADDAFDITICHQVLTYLRSPSDALREMMRITKPGGIVAAREGDLATECVWPELPGLLKSNKLAGRLLGLSGGTDKGGRQLLSWALEAGVERKDITLSYGTWSYNAPDEREAWGKFLFIL